MQIEASEENIRNATFAEETIFFNPENQNRKIVVPKIADLNDCDTLLIQRILVGNLVIKHSANAQFQILVPNSVTSDLTQKAKVVDAMMGANRGIPFVYVHGYRI